jgi:hypothetical protein
VCVCVCLEDRINFTLFCLCVLPKPEWRPRTDFDGDCLRSEVTLPMSGMPAMLVVSQWLPALLVSILPHRVDGLVHLSPAVCHQHDFPQSSGITDWICRTALFHETYIRPFSNKLSESLGTAEKGGPVCPLYRSSLPASTPHLTLVQNE